MKIFTALFIGFVVILAYITITQIIFVKSSGADTDASIGSPLPQHIKCYSASTIFYEGISAGTMWANDNGSWTFVDKSNGKITRVMGSCVAITQ